MEPRVFDNVKHEKENAMASFNWFRRIVKLWQFFEVLVILGLISWLFGRFPAVLKVTGRYLVEFSNYLFNHHVVFLIGNAIVVVLFMLCPQNDGSVSGGGGGDFYDDYEKYSEGAAHQREPALPRPPITEDAPAPAPHEESGGGDAEKQIVARAQETETISQCDDVAGAIEKATRLMERFQRTQSEKLKREISVRPLPELRRSETENRRKTASSRSADAPEIETLSKEEFRRRVDAFIDRHRRGRETKQIQFREYENYPLLKTA